MGLTRLLTLAALGLILYLAWVRLRAWRGRNAPTGDAAERGGRMVRCRRCGLFVPEGDAVRDAKGHVYCSSEHRDASTGDSDA